MTTCCLGIVSNLVTIVLTSLSAPCIEEDAFLADMAAQDIRNATFCSPLLVNAMCAVGAFSSSYTEAVEAIDGRKLGEQFFNESRRLLDEERGKPSLATMQGLFMLYQYTTSAAMDRAGRIFRLSACEMYSRLKLGTHLIIRGRVEDEDARRKVLSRISWGAFCIERLVYIKSLH